MRIKAEYPSEEEVPQEHIGLFEERGGKWLLTQVEGIVTQADVERVSTALTQERAAHKETNGKLTSVLGDKTAEEIAEIVQKHPELIERAEAGDKGGLDEEAMEKIVANRVRAQTGPMERELTQLRTDLGTAQGAIGDFETAAVKRTIRGEIRKVALGIAGSIPKIRTSAEEDVLDRAERDFIIEESGAVVSRDGKTIELWLTDMQPLKPHWWPESEGGGALGSGKGGGKFPKNPWTAEHWNVTAQGQAYRELGAEQAAKMAEAAGSKIGGRKPAAKKAA